MEATKTTEELMKEYYDALDADIIACHEAALKRVSELVKKNEELQKKIGGRPSLGVTKKVSVTLPQEDWDKIKDLIAHEHVESFSEYFRELHNNQFK